MFPQLPIGSLLTRRKITINDINFIATSGNSNIAIAMRGATDVVSVAGGAIGGSLVALRGSANSESIAFCGATVTVLASRGVISTVSGGESAIAIADLTSVSLPPDSDVVAYRTIYEGAGNAFSTGEFNALNTFVAALKSLGIWAKLRFLWICPASPSNTTGASLYVKPYSGVDRMTMTGFTTGDFSLNGVTGGAGKYANSGLAANILFAINNQTFAYHSNTSSYSGGSTTAWGCNSGAISDIGFYPKYSDGNLYYVASTNTQPPVAVTAVSGLYVAQYDGTTAIVYKDTTTLLSSTVSTGGDTIPSNNIYLFAYNLGGTAIAYSPMRYSLFAAYSTQLTTTERDDQVNAYSTYCSAIGRTF